MPQPSRPWRATQPLKAMCIAYFYLSTPPWLVYLLLKFALLRGLRPSPQLSLKANVGNPIVRSLFNVITRTRSPRLVAENLPKDNTRVTAVSVPPLPLFTGVLTSNPTIKPAPLKALWFPRAPPSEANLAEETVVLHLPGGAFVVEVGHEAFGRKAADAMLHGKQAARFVWAQYRLASTPGQAFPAAIQDAVSFYAHVLSLGYQPKNVVVSGDSAGGNAALALLRYLQDTKVLPLPRGVMTWSPWVEVTPRAGRDFASTGAAVASTDILTPEFLQWGADAYLPRGAALTDEIAEYVSPLHRPFRTEVPVFLHAGEAEGFCPTVQKFAEQMEEANGGGERVRFHATPHAVHDLLLVWEGQDMRKEIDAAVRDAWETVGA